METMQPPHRSKGSNTTEALSPTLNISQRHKCLLYNLYCPKKKKKPRTGKEGETVGLQYNGRGVEGWGGNRKDFHHTAWVMRTQRRCSGVFTQVFFFFSAPFELTSDSTAACGLETVRQSLSVSSGPDISLNGLMHVNSELSLTSS